MQSSEEAVRRAIKDWQRHGHGKISKEKPDGTIRLSFENWNSLKVHTEKELHKVRRIEATRKEYEVDITTGVECQANWSVVEPSRQFAELFGTGEDKQSVAAHNRHWKTVKSQYGGAAMTAVGTVSGYVDGRGSDKLGRWSWMYFRSGDTKVRILTAYRPKKPSQIRRRGVDVGAGGTVWEQQVRYYRSKDCDDLNPISHYDRDLMRLLTDWRSSGDEVILCIDANTHMNEGRFSKMLGSRPVSMTELFYRQYGKPGPPSHRDGSIPISGIFVSPGIDVTSVFVSGHNSLTQGDHRLWLVDIDMRSMLGDYAPIPKRMAGRILQCKNDRTRKQYISALESFCRVHRMEQKLRVIEARMTTLEETSDCGDSWEAIDEDFNKWDEEHVRLQRAAEQKLSKKKNDRIEYSPESNVWIRRMQVLRWIQSWRKKGKKKSRTSRKKRDDNKGNPANLKRACRNNNLPSPDTMTDEQVEREIVICRKKLSQLQLTSPKMRRRHLERRLKYHVQNDNKEKINAVATLISAEQTRRLWAPLKVFRGKKSAPPSRVETIDAEGNPVVYSDKHGVESAASEHLLERFKTARTCPFEEGGLHEDFAFKASTQATDEVFNGTYVPPEDADATAVHYLEEAKLLWDEHQTIIDVTFTPKDYSWWQTAREKTESSKSGIHFGHYKAQSFSKLLTSIQVLKLNLVYKRGRPLRRWLHALTLLLAKKAGGSSIDKLRAICLLEADCNWSFKVIFAKKTMANANDHDLIPPELFARSGTSATQGCFARIMWCDVNRTLNNSFSVQSCDLGQCYDAINHVAASIALQSFGVPKKTVDIMHTVLQEMQFWLRTAFGDSDVPFGGSALDPTMGEGQGSGAAPPTFTSMSTVMIRLLKKHGFHSELKGSWSDAILCILAILYVDDIDMLLAALSAQDNDEFIEMVQKAITEWGKIVMVTGGYLKQVKCQVALAIVDFVNGEPRLRSASSNSDIEFTIPTKSGDDVPITVVGPNDAVEGLGIFTDLVNSGTHHLEAIETKTIEWTSKLKSSRVVKKADAWRSFSYQLKFKLIYSISCMSAPPGDVDKIMNKLFYECLSYMGVNRNIRRDARCLPSAWGGLGMFDLNLENLGARCLLIQNHWGTTSVDGQALQVGYETFRVDTGLGGNIFDRDYNEVGHLAKHSWWKHTWHLCYIYKVKITFESRFEPLASRENDSTLMDVLVSRGIWNKHELGILNRVRRYKQVYFRSDVIACNGRTVRPDMLDTSPGSSTWRFAREQPTTRDFSTWRAALANISSPNFAFQSSAGRLRRQPPNHGGWYIDESLRTIVRKSPEGTQSTFCCASDRQTRHSLYTLDETATSDSIDISTWRLASVDAESSDNHPSSVRLHSTCPQPSPQQTQVSETLLDALRQLPNPGLWDTAECDGDGWWIEESLNNGDLVVVSDGSYKKEKAPDVCSCAFRLLCKRRRLKFQCTWVERISTAGIYRGEVLGAVGYLIVLKTVINRKSSTTIRPGIKVKAIADNLGVISRGRTPLTPLKMNQPQADALSLMKNIISDLPIHIAFIHVNSHLDDHVEYDQLPFDNQQNSDVDALAQGALDEAVDSGNFIQSYFPYQRVTVHCSGKKITSNYTSSIYFLRGRQSARDVMHSKGLLTPDQFEVVHWEAIHHLFTKVYPQMFRVWYAKHVFQSNGCMHDLHRNDPSTYPSPACPCCGFLDETTDHIIRCYEPGRKNLYKDSVDDLVKWMKKENTQPIIVLLIQGYLKARANQTMVDTWLSCGGRSDDTQLGYQLALAHDTLGWTNFVAGRIHCKFVEVQTNHLLSQTNYRRRKSPSKWASGLVDMIIRITHRQWLYRNEFIHYTKYYGAESSREYERIMSRINHLHEHTDPDDLFPEDQHLLDEDIDNIATWSANQRHTWTAELETSLAARRARVTKRKRNQLRLGVIVTKEKRTKRRRQENRTRDLPLQSSRRRNRSLSLTAEGSQRRKRRKKRKEGT